METIKGNDTLFSGIFVLIVGIIIIICFVVFIFNIIQPTDPFDIPCTTRNYDNNIPLQVIGCIVALISLYLLLIVIIQRREKNK